MTGDAISESDEELLSAYLDGELGSEQRRDFQLRLANEPMLRERLVTYQQAWNLLDQYPETPQKASFTKSTLEMAAVGVAEETPSRSDRSPSESRRLRLPSWALWLVASSILGSSAGLAFRWQRMQSELERLLPAAHLPSLRFIQDLPEAEKLLTMPELEWFANHVDGVSERILPPIPRELPARRDWVQQLSLTHQSILWRRVRELEKLSDQEQQEVISTARALDTSNSGDELWSRMAIVCTLIDSISDEEKLALKSLEPGKRLLRLEELLFGRLAVWYAEHLENGDRDVLLPWAGSFIIANLPRNISRIPGSGDRIPPFAQEVFFRELLRDPSRINLVEESFEEVQPQLTPMSQQILRGVHPRDRSMIIATWAIAALGNRGRSFDEADLWTAYLRQKDEERNLLDLRSPEAVRESLRGDLIRRGRAPAKREGENAPPATAR
jgi:hypothetical protein